MLTSTIVRNKFPTIETGYRLAIIGEAPGADEEIEGEPFVGTSGRFLTGLMSRAGLSRSACFIGNVCQVRPPMNQIHSFTWSGPEIQDGLATLKADLMQFKPNCCMLLGRVALKAAKDMTAHPLDKGFTHSIDEWRGSVFMPSDINSPMFGFKSIASFHPAAVLRQYRWAPLLQFDLKKAARESRYPEIHTPVRKIDMGLTFHQTRQSLESLLIAAEQGNVILELGSDIEGYWNALTCVALAKHSNEAFVVPFQRKNGSSYFSVDEEAEIWRLVALVMAHPRIFKVWQNGLYDRFCFQYGHKIPVYGNKEDIMLKHHELYCEIEKGLGVQTSLYTEEPYYKSDRKTNDDNTYWLYNGKDSCVTKEISGFLTPKLDERATKHYRFNHTLLNPLLYMELRGIRYDTEKATTRRRHILQAFYNEQYKMDTIANCVPDQSNPNVLLQRVKSECCIKRCIVLRWEDLRGNWLKEKKQGVEDWFRVHEDRIIELGKKAPNMTPSELGEFSALCYFHMNVDSNKQFQEYIYGKLALPLQTKKDPKTKIEKPTTDYEALLKLVKKTGHPACRVAIDLRGLGTRAGMLAIHADPDGRIRCGYNIVGTETGRLSCYTSPTGSGYNLQTIPNHTDTARAPGGILGDRDLFLADEGHQFFQCDLSGADGWTVAAHLRSLGQPTMYDDYVYGLKPAKILVLMLRHGTGINSKSREELKELSKTVEKESWEYFACKIGQHGTCYLMGAIQLANKIFIESEGKVHLSSRESGDIQKLFEHRYRVTVWHQHTSSKLSIAPNMIAASGHRRVFFGRASEILGEALAHEPQANTTYATNLAAYNLWMDAENRLDTWSDEGAALFKLRYPTREVPRNKTILRVEPLHQVHDALCGQFANTDTEFAKTKIRNWFDNPLFIAGQRVTIPYEGGYGPSWGNLKNGEL